MPARLLAASAALSLSLAISAAGVVQASSATAGPSSGAPDVTATGRLAVSKPGCPAVNLSPSSVHLDHQEMTLVADGTSYAGRVSSAANFRLDGPAGPVLGELHPVHGVAREGRFVVLRNDCRYEGVLSFTPILAVGPSIRWAPPETHRAYDWALGAEAFGAVAVLVGLGLYWTRPKRPAAGAAAQ